MEERGFIVTLILFLIPGFPKSALCYIIGSSNMNVWTFIIISSAGRLFGTILSSLSGDWIRNQNITAFVFLIAILMILFILTYFYRKQLLAITKIKK